MLPVRADALRLYVMFVAPPEKEVEWSDAGLEGSFRFLLRVWRLVDHWAETIRGDGIPACTDDGNDAERRLRRKTHETIRRVTVDVEERMHLNTAVSALMELVNELYVFSEQTVRGGPARPVVQSCGSERPQTIGALREAIDALVLMLSPFAPHAGEEMWQLIGHRGGLAGAAWPSFDPAVARADHGRARPDQRQSAREADDPGRHVRRWVARCGAGRSHRRQSHGGQGDSQGGDREGPLVSIVIR